MHGSIDYSWLWSISLYAIAWVMSLSWRGVEDSPPLVGCRMNEENMQKPLLPMRPSLLSSSWDSPSLSSWPGVKGKPCLCCAAASKATCTFSHHLQGFYLQNDAWFFERFEQGEIVLNTFGVPRNRSRFWEVFRNPGSGRMILSPVASQCHCPGPSNHDSLNGKPHRPWLKSKVSEHTDHTLA